MVGPTVFGYERVYTVLHIAVIAEQTFSVCIQIKKVSDTNSLHNVI